MRPGSIEFDPVLADEILEFRSCASFDLLAFLNRYRERLNGGQLFIRKRLPIEPFRVMG
jgi:hypothetical protein